MYIYNTRSKIIIKSIKIDYIKWLDSPSLNVFITVSLKQSLQNVNGIPIRIMDTDIKRTGWLLRDRFTKKIIGKKAWRAKNFPAFLVFSEGDGMIKRHHLHIVAERPPGIPPNEYEAIFRETARRLDWVYGEIDVRQLSYQRGETEASGCLRYVFKEGTGAFIPEASFTPNVY